MDAGAGRCGNGEHLPWTSYTTAPYIGDVLVLLLGAAFVPQRTFAFTRYVDGSLSSPHSRRRGPELPRVASLRLERAPVCYLFISALLAAFVLAMRPSRSFPTSSVVVVTY